MSKNADQKPAQIKETTYQKLLLRIMERNGLTQSALAKKAGVDKIALCRILNEKYAYKPTKVLPKLIDAAGATAEERIHLYRLCGAMPPEIVRAFCSSDVAAAQMIAAAKAVKRGGGHHQERRSKAD